MFRPQPQSNLLIFIIPVAEHSVIVTAIQTGDADTAQRGIQTNWRNAEKRVGALITEWGENGGW